MRENLFSLIAMAAMVLLFSQPSSAAPSEACLLSKAEGALLNCYRDEFHEKVRANDLRHKDIIAKAKDLIQSTVESDVNQSTASYLELVRKANQSVLNTRSSAARSCLKMAARFKSPETSSVASVNCRTSHEVQLERELRRIELQIETLSVLR